MPPKRTVTSLTDSSASTGWSVPVTSRSLSPRDSQLDVSPLYDRTSPRPLLPEGSSCPARRRTIVGPRWHAGVVTSTIEPTTQRDARPPAGDGAMVLPWWRNPVNLVAVLVAVAALFGALGYTLGTRHAEVRGNSVDEGFLQDMRFTTRTRS